MSSIRYCSYDFIESYLEGEGVSNESEEIDWHGQSDTEYARDFSNSGPGVGN